MSHFTSRTPCAVLLVATLLALILPPIRPAAGQTAVNHSREVVDLALDRHPELAAAGIDADAMRAHAAWLKALPDPRFDVAWFPYRVFTARGSQRSRLSVEQTIPWPGLRAARSEVARSNAERLDQDALRLALDISRDTRLAWNRAWRAGALTRIARQFQVNLSRFETSATNRYETGEEAMAPLISIQLEGAALDLAMERLSEDLLLARRDLARLADIPDLALPDSLPPVYDLALPDSLMPGFDLAPGGPKGPFADPPARQAQDLIQTALAARPDLRGLEALRRSRLDDAEVARLSARPDFIVGLNWVDTAEEAFLPNGDGRDALGLRLGITVPLWGAARRAPKERARLLVAEVEAQIRARQTAIRTEVEELSARLTSQEEQLRQLSDVLVPRAGIAQHTALTAYRSGQTSLLQVLDAERTLYRLQTEYIDVAARLMETHILLERALGSPPDSRNHSHHD
ncbi:MAG: hypothetical protein COV99_02965 [Bacteroidetes bacterium CG12_big_fil_rev_8_21_14_0_65_60_17]|nr:MAG: hypothetical protein COV99_02965 [Bacteroidetes bacterium CG12_big_fil_rev_8_21_14_0_65_60_17]